MRKKILSLALALTICLGLMPELVLRAEGEALRGAISALSEGAATRATAAGPVQAPTRDYWNVPLLNARTVNDTAVMNSYVYNNGLLTAGKNFKLTGWNKEDMTQPPDNLYDAYSHEFTKIYDNSSWYATYTWNIGVQTSLPYWNFQQAVQRGEISYIFTGDLKYDRHVHRKGPTKHWQLRDYAQVVFYRDGSESNQIGSLINNENQSEESWISMKMGWSKLPTNVQNTLTLLFTHDERTNCYCGSSGVRKPIIAFADTVYPTVTRVTVKSDSYYYNSSSDPIQFTLQFSESIRAADGSTVIDPSDTTKVKLTAYTRETRQNYDVYAHLISMTESSLTFEVEMPEGADIIITGIAGESDQRRNILKPDQTFKMYTNDQTDRWQTISGNSGALKSNAAFTDFAGNGIDEKWRSMSFSHELHVDTVLPTYTGTLVEAGSMLRDQDMKTLTDNPNWNATESWSGGDIDRSQVFAGVGDWIKLAATFSEELETFTGTGAANGAADASHFTATLNVLKGDGSPVTLRGTSIESYRTSINNNILASKLHFETLTITSDMRPDPKNIGPIKIVSIAVNDGTAQDMCDNPLDLTKAEYINPDKQEWLDTLAPNVTVGYPTPEGEGIKIPIQITEQTYTDLGGQNPTLFKSGIAGVEDAKESASLFIHGVNGGSYQYQVTATVEANDAKWIDATGDVSLKIPQLESSIYLHIRLPEGAELPIFGGFTLDVTAYDYAGNKGEALDQSMNCDLKEKIAPTAEAAFYPTAGGTFIAGATVKDKGGISEIWYKMDVHTSDENTDDNPVTAVTSVPEAEGNGWEKIDLSADSVVEYPIPVVNVTGIEKSRNNFVYLSIVAKDKSGNVFTHVYSFQQDLRLPGYSVEIPDEVTGKNKDSTKIKIGLMDVEQAKNISPVNVWHTSVDGYLWHYGTLLVTVQQEQGNKDYTLTKLVDELVDTNSPADKAATTKPGESDRNPAREYEFKEIDDLLGELESLERTDGTEVTGTHSFEIPLGWRYYEDGGAFLTAITEGTLQPELKFNDSEYAFQGIYDREDVHNAFKNPYYGNLNIYLSQMGAQLYSGRDISHYVATDEPNRKTPSITKYTVKVKLDDGKGGFNKATFHAPVAANGQVLMTETEDGRLSNADARLKDDSTYSPSYEDTPTAFRTLAGITVPFTVGNNRVPEWGLEDIDFEKSKIQVWYSPNLHPTEESFSFVEDFDLTSGSAEQAFTFPETLADGAYKTGIYKIVVVLKTFAFDHEDTCDASGSFVFRVCAMDPTEDGGIHSVYITETKKLASDDASDCLDFQVLDGDMDSAAIGTYTVPVIRTVTAEGASSNAYFIPFFTYQNQYVNIGKQDLYNSVLAQLKVWVTTEDGDEDVKWLRPSMTLGSDETDFGFTFGVIPGGMEIDGNYTSNCFTVAAGESVTINMQEYYANGEIGTIRQLTVTVPKLAEAHTPTVDVSCATGVPSSTVSVNVKDISSLNGMGENSSIHVAPGGLDGWSTDEWHEAAVQNVTEEMTREVQDEAGGTTTETVTYTRSLLSINGNTVLGGDQTKDFLQNLIGEYNFENPVIIAVDDAYNVTVREVDDLVTDWDPKAPSVDGQDVSEDSFTYAADLTLSETFIPDSLDELKFYITTVNPETGAGDSAAAPTKAVDTIVIPFSELVKGEAFTTTYDGSTANTPGVYGITVAPLEDYRQSYGSEWITPMWGPREAISINVTVEGVRPTTPVYIYCVDELGQRSEVVEIPAADSTAKPEVDQDKIERDTDGSLKLTFTQPVVLLEPEVTNAQHKLETVKTGIPIYSDGNYTVKYMDIFGKEYEEQITVALDGDFKFTTSFVPGELTNQDVTFRLDTQAGESGIYTTVTNVEIPEGTGEVTTQADHQVIVTMRTNGVIKVTLQYGNEPLEKIFPVTFIDKKLDDVKITWEYDANAVGEDGVTIADYVTAVVTLQDPNSDEELIGTEGELRYTFPNNSKQGAQHIFKYKDAAGNEGSITATLNYNIVLPIPPRLTGYGMKVSHTAMTQTYDDLTFRFTAGAKVADGDGEKDLTPPDFKDIFTDPDTDAVIPAKEVIINLSTEIDADIYILGPGATVDEARRAAEDVTVDGVLHAGKNIVVSKNTGFTIAIVEKQETVTEAGKAESEDADKSTERKTYLIPVTIENIAVLKGVSVRVEKKSTYEWWAYFDPEQNTDLTLTNVKSDTEVRYDEARGMYYHVFRENGKYTFTYRDSVGNTGSIEAEVTEIPSGRTPEGKPSWWPYGKDQNPHREHGQF